MALIKKVNVTAFEAAARTVGCFITLKLNESVCGLESAIVGKVGPTSQDSRDKEIHQADIKAAIELGKLFAKILKVPLEIYKGEKPC